ncbi:Hsp70 family protein, partial [bacterium]|nr:Hsp70 family protein [bacterium]
QKIAEEMKRVLSVKEKVSEVIHGSGGDHTIEITRNEFEASIQSYLEKLKMLMEECLDGSGVNPEDVNHTLLVGGSTRVPIVTKTIENVMKKPPLKGVNVDEAVANGAAIFAGLKTDKKSLNNAQQKALSNVHLQDVCNFYMGVLMNVEDPLYNRAIDINKVIIDRDTPLPASKTTSAQTIRDNQTAINCQITQSEGKQRDKEFVNIIHEGDLKLPSNRPKGQPVEITYSYDVSGKMHCVFEDVNSGKKYEVDVRPKSSEDLKAQFSEIEEITIE